MTDAAPPIASELVGRTLKVYLDAPPEARHGLPSKVTLPIESVKAMIETWGNKTNKKELLVGKQSVTMFDEMD